MENVRVKKDNFTKQLYTNTAKTGTVIRPTEPHTEVLAPRLTDDYPTTTVTGSVAGVTATSREIPPWNSWKSMEFHGVP